MKKGSIRIFGWVIFLVGAVFVINSFFQVTSYIPKEWGSFLGLALEVLGFFMIVAKYHEN